jgi:hypothetical protein
MEVKKNQNKKPKPKPKPKQFFPPLGFGLSRFWALLGEGRPKTENTTYGLGAKPNKYIGGGGDIWPCHCHIFGL